MLTILAFLHFLLVIWALVNIFQSSASTGGKLIWLLFVFFFPAVGFVCWLLFGPRSARTGVA